MELVKLQIEYMWKMARRDFEFEKAKQENRALRLEFIVTELELATTFATSAEAAASDEKATRYLDYARQAYNAARHFIRSATPEPEMTEYINTKMERLRALLEELGQRLDR